MGRKLLSTGDKITLKNFRNGELLELEITSTPLGEGGSCIVYEAREAGSGLVCKYRLKELYPENIDGIDRDKSNQLIIGNNIRPEYHEACTRFDKSLKLLWDIAYSNDTGNYTVCPLGKFIGMTADTPAQYLITQWMPSDSLNTANLCGSDDLYLIAKICLKTAMAVKEFHKKGYINFDIKPENILYSPQTDNIAFFDTDTVFKRDEIQGQTVMFSEGAAPEIVNGFEKLYSEKVDVFSIGSMLHRFIFGENYFTGQYSTGYSNSADIISLSAILKCANPCAAATVLKIWSRCSPGNPIKRCSINELISMLSELTVFSDPGSIYAESSYIQPPNSNAEEYGDELYSIRQKLLKQHYVLVQGLHGSGKTDFIKNYALSFSGFYPTIIWADLNENIKDTVSKIKFVGINDEEYDNKEQLFEVKFNRLKKYDDRLLLIIDGYDSPDSFLAEFLESLDVHILISSTCCSNEIDSEHIYTMKKEQQQMFNQEEKEELYNKMTKLKKANRSLRLFCQTLLYISVTALIASVSMYVFVSKAFAVSIIILTAVIFILKSLTFGKASKEAVFNISRKYCYKHYKEASFFAGNENNQQTFEIAASDFISNMEDKRHRFRIILGISAISCGMATAVISFIINSFPFLIALYSLIIMVVFIVDYEYSFRMSQNIYNTQFGGTGKGEKRSFYEIYNFKSPSDKADKNEKLSPECERLIIYNEYKTRCNIWGTIDIIAKSFAGVNILSVIFDLFPILPNNYFRIPPFFPKNSSLCLGMIIYILLTVVPAAMSKDFYYNIKELLFTAFSDDRKFISEKFTEYTDEALISSASSARGIYNFAVIQFEKGIPIYEIRKAERPTFAQYCTSHSVSAIIYLSFMTIIELSVIVWHFSVYSAFIPILAVNIAFMLWWEISGIYKYSKRKLKVTTNETVK